MRGVLMQVDIMAPANASDQWRVLASRTGCRIRRPVEFAELPTPPEDVFASVTSGNPPMTTNRQVHAPTGFEQLLRDLAPGSSCTDNDHRTLGQRLRIPVLARMDLNDLWRNARSHHRNLGPLVRARRDHHVPRIEVAMVGFQLVPPLSGGGC